MWKSEKFNFSPRLGIAEGERMEIEIEIHSVDEKLPETDSNIVVLGDGLCEIADKEIFNICPQGITHWFEIPPLPEKRRAAIGQVWRNNLSNRIFVVRSERSIENIEQGGYSKIADSPHENDDFSYVCGSDYCRCMQ